MIQSNLKFSEQQSRTHTWRVHPLKFERIILKVLPLISNSTYLTFPLFTGTPIKENKIKNKILYFRTGYYHEKHGESH